MSKDDEHSSSLEKKKLPVQKSESLRNEGLGKSFVHEVLGPVLDRALVNGVSSVGAAKKEKEKDRVKGVANPETPLDAKSIEGLEMIRKGFMDLNPELAWSTVVELLGTINECVLLSSS